MVVFLVGCIYSAYYYKNTMLGYGPLTSASEHGFELDSIFNVTLIFTGIVFVLTHILLFWYTYKYRKQSCLLYTSPSPRDRTRSRMPSSA